MSSDLYPGTDGSEVFDGGDSDANPETTDGSDTLLEEGATEDDTDYTDYTDYTEWLDDGSEDEIASEESIEDVPTDEDYNDPYLFGWGDGWGYLEASTDPELGELNTIQFAEGVNPEDILLVSDGTNLTITIAGMDGEITVENFLSQDDIYGSDNPLQQIVFSDGTTWDLSNILAQMTDSDTIPVSEIPEEPVDWLGLIDPIEPIDSVFWETLQLQVLEEGDPGCQICVEYYPNVVSEPRPAMQVIGSAAPDEAQDFFGC